jgi:predicted DCC family thiol-disulfide oxidoreductase YuxK
MFADHGDILSSVCRDDTARVPLRQFRHCIPLAPATIPRHLAAQEVHVMLPPSQDIIVFDVTCIFCSGFARFMHRRDTAHRFVFVTAQSDTGRDLYHKYSLDPDDMTTNIVIVDGVAFTKMQAFGAAMRSLGGAWRLAGWPALLPRPMADWIYDRIARNRYVFGKRACPVPPPELKARLIE